MCDDYPPNPDDGIIFLENLPLYTTKDSFETELRPIYLARAPCPSSYTLVLEYGQSEGNPQQHRTVIPFVVLLCEDFRGKGFVQLQHAADVASVVERLDGIHYRKIRTLKTRISSRAERDAVLRAYATCVLEGGFLVRLRGLAYDITEDRIRDFLSRQLDRDIVDTLAIDISRYIDGITSGDAFIHCQNTANVQKLLKLDMRRENRRSIEVMEATRVDMSKVISANQLRESHGWHRAKAKGFRGSRLSQQQEPQRYPTMSSNDMQFQYPHRTYQQHQSQLYQGVTYAPTLPSTSWYRPCSSTTPQQQQMLPHTTPQGFYGAQQQSPQTQQTMYTMNNPYASATAEQQPVLPQEFYGAQQQSPQTQQTMYTMNNPYGENLLQQPSSSYSVAYNGGYPQQYPMVQLQKSQQQQMPTTDLQYPRNRTEQQHSGQQQYPTYYFMQQQGGRQLL